MDPLSPDKEKSVFRSTKSKSRSNSSSVSDRLRPCKQPNIEIAEAPCSSKRPRSAPFKLGTSFKYGNKKAAIYAVAFNQYCEEDDDPEFVIVSRNQAVLYNVALEDESEEFKIEKMLVFEDENKKESFCAVCWSFDPVEKNEVICVAGALGVIRVIDLETFVDVMDLHGHGMGINELRAHPTRVGVIGSVSEDYSARLWHVNSGVFKRVVFGGFMAHRDSVVSLDFSRCGDFLITSGMDHAVKVINLKKVWEELDRNTKEKERTVNDVFEDLIADFREHLDDIEVNRKKEESRIEKMRLTAMLERERRKYLGKRSTKKSRGKKKGKHLPPLSLQRTRFSARVAMKTKKAQAEDVVHEGPVLLTHGSQGMSFNDATQNDIEMIPIHGDSFEASGVGNNEVTIQDEGQNMPLKFGTAPSLEFEDFVLDEMALMNSKSLEVPPEFETAQTDDGTEKRTNEAGVDTSSQSGGHDKEVSTTKAKRDTRVEDREEKIDLMKKMPRNKRWELKPPPLYDDIPDVIDIPGPCCTTLDPHVGYVDCVRVLGHFIVSKASNNEPIVIWKFGSFTDPIDGRNRGKQHIVWEESISIYQAFENSQCNCWFVKFDLDPKRKWLVCGNEIGELSFWSFNDDPTEDMNEERKRDFSLKISKACIRNLAFEPFGRFFIAVTDDGYVNRIDRVCPDEEDCANSQTGSVQPPKKQPKTERESSINFGSQTGEEPLDIDDDMWNEIINGVGEVDSTQIRWDPDRSPKNQPMAGFEPKVVQKSRVREEPMEEGDLTDSVQLDELEVDNIQPRCDPHQAPKEQPNTDAEPDMCQGSRTGQEPKEDENDWLDMSDIFDD